MSCKASLVQPWKAGCKVLQVPTLSTGVLQAVAEPSPSCIPLCLSIRANWLLMFDFVGVFVISCLLGKQGY